MMNQNTYRNQEQTAGKKMILEEMETHPPQRHAHHDCADAPCRTLEDLCFYWLQNRLDAVKKSTYSAYHYCVNTHILPLTGNTPLSELNGERILFFMEKTQEKELANSTLRFIFATFRFILKYGIRSRLIEASVLSYCSVSCRRNESRMLTMQDSSRMKDFLLKKNTIFSLAILLCRGTGIRVGELCGLQWGDMDFESRTFQVRRTVSRIPNPAAAKGEPKTILYIRTPKSATSSREIPIPEYLVRPLKNLRQEDDQYLLTGRGICTEPRNVQKRFKTILRDCKMQDCNFHAMRHGFATACLEKGVDCKTVSAVLGHASTRTTMEIYVHTSIRQKQNCINTID